MELPDVDLDLEREVVFAFAAPAGRLVVLLRLLEELFRVPLDELFRVPLDELARVPLDELARVPVDELARVPLEVLFRLPVDERDADDPVREAPPLP